MVKYNPELRCFCNTSQSEGDLNIQFWITYDQRIITQTPRARHPFTPQQAQLHDAEAIGIRLKFASQTNMPPFVLETLRSQQSNRVIPFAPVLNCGSA